MNLIKVSDRVLINPSRISAVESKIVRGKETVSVTVDGKTYEVAVKIDEFLRQISSVTQQQGQRFEL